MTQLSGYAISPNMSSTDGASLVQTLFSMDADAAIDSASRLLACFLQNEAHFAGLVGGEETQIIPKFGMREDGPLHPDRRAPRVAGVLGDGRDVAAHVAEQDSRARRIHRSFGAVGGIAEADHRVASRGWLW